MIKTSIAALAFLLLANSAHAATINLDVTLGPSVTYGTGGTYTPNLPLFPASSSGLTLTGNAHIVPGFVTIPNFVRRPTGPLLQNDYLAVLHNPGTPGTAVLTLGANNNELAFRWGSIDSFNSLLLTVAGGQTFTITGADILSHLTGPAVDGVTNANIKFYDPFVSIVSATFTSTQNSFEAANFYQGSAGTQAPLPPAMILFGTALLALGFYAHRQRQAKT